MTRDHLGKTFPEQCSKGLTARIIDSMEDIQPTVSGIPDHLLLGNFAWVHIPKSMDCNEPQVHGLSAVD